MLPYHSYEIATYNNIEFTQFSSTQLVVVAMRMVQCI